MSRQTKTLFRNPFFVIGVVIVAINLLITLGGAYFRPDPSPFANEQHLELAALEPGAEVNFLRMRRNQNAAESSGLYGYIIGQSDQYDYLAYKHLSFLDHYAVIEPIGKQTKMHLHLADVCYALRNKDGLATLRDGDLLETVEGGNVEYRSEALRSQIQRAHLIKRRYILGTDRYGRDVLSRLMSGSAISLSVGFIAVVISLLIGLSFGTVAGYYRGWTDRIVMWFINIVWSVPTLLLVIAITLLLGKGFWQIFVAVGLTMWVEVARVVRGQVMSLREKEFIQAGVVLGYSNFRIIVRHVLPNVLSPVIVISAANFATAILLEAGLSFLGIGAPPPQATWGKMISEHKAYIVTGDAHLAIIPGLAIMLLVLSFTFIGNSLRDAFDETLEHAG